jgi:glutathione synthase/RimK-type ligase-like ATP-grasp enzyme
VTRRPVVLFATDHNLGSDEDKEVQRAWTNDSIELLLIDWEDSTQQEELFKKYKEQKRTFVVVIRSTWNYHLRADKFKQWLRDLELRGVPLYNSCDLISWNMHKHYLFELNDWGLSTVPTLKLDSLDLTRYFTALDTNEIVIKPCISAGSHRTIRITREQIQTTNTQEIEQWMKESDYIVQPFIQGMCVFNN